MPRLWILLTALLCVSAPTLAQVTVDLHALDALPGAKPAKPKAHTHAVRPKSSAPQVTTETSHKPVTKQEATAKPAPATTATGQPAQQSPAAPAPPPATIPAAPPATVAIAPVTAPPPAGEPVPPPPPPPISESANSAATPSNAGLRVTFGSGQSDLSPASAAAIQHLVNTAPRGDATSYNVVAYAAGTPDDPSTARRLSLSRALAVRSALMADGISSSRIYVRALGAVSGDDAPDRVDLAVLGANAADAGPAQPSTKATQQ